MCQIYLHTLPPIDRLRQLEAASRVVSGNIASIDSLDKPDDMGGWPSSPEMWTWETRRLK